MQLLKAYSHNEIEGKWYNYWAELGAFQPDESPLPIFPW